jgi:hypothetical protein
LAGASDDWGSSWRKIVSAEKIGYQHVEKEEISTSSRELISTLKLEDE